MKKDRRWMKSVLAASVEQTVTLPWHRATRKKPQSPRPAADTGRRAALGR